MIIAVDGTLASGKGTIARALAAAFGLPCLDTGALYRGVAVAVLDAGADPHNGEQATALARTFDPASLDEMKIRTSAAGAAASVVSAHAGVRDALFDLQRRFANQDGGAVLDGRDIGTVICPDADVKLFIDAKPAVRAWRRWQELSDRGEDIALAEIERQLAIRDARDAGRPDAPMKPAADAVLLDTTQLSIDAAIGQAVELVSDKTGVSPIT